MPGPLKPELLELAAPKVVSPSRIARYYFHECERFLRYSSTPGHLRSIEAVPTPPADTRPVTRAILEGGYTWEEWVVSRYLPGRVAIAPGAGQLRDRFHSIERTRELVSSLAAGQFIYQPALSTPSSFYQRYGIDPNKVRIADCRPDLIECLAGPSTLELRVIDIKASPGLKLSHRIQAVLYSLILSHQLGEWGVQDRVVSDSPAIWLAGNDQPEAFDIRTIRPPMEAFLQSELQRILGQPAGKAPWHVYYRCEWCEYFTICREEMRTTDNVSRLPYLSTHAKRFLASLEPSIQSIPELDEVLNSDRSGILDSCASLRGQQDRLALETDALLTGRTQVHGGSSLAMPRAEHVRIILTLQRDPVSSQIYAFGLYGQGLREVMGENPESRIEVAVTSDHETIKQLERSFVRSLNHLLKSVDDYNATRSQDWSSQKTLQVYVFDAYERDFLIDLLVRSLDDVEVAEDALRLFFYFQRPELIQAEDHPADEVFFPITIVIGVLRDLFALPVEVTYRFTEISRLMAPSQFAFPLGESELFSFELSNQMRSDAIFMVWHHQRADLVPAIRQQVRNRLRAANSVINGIRETLGGTNTLFAWPPKFRLPAGFGYRHALLSRLAFMTQYESVISYLALRQARMAPLDDRLKSGQALRLSWTGANRFTIDPIHRDVEIDASGFPGWILTEDSEQGQRAALSYDDYANRARVWVPRNLSLGLAAITQIESTLDAPNQALQLTVSPSPAMPPLRLRGRYLLHPRYTDFNGSKAVAELSAIDAEAAPHFVRLIGDPRSCLASQPLSQTQVRSLGLAERLGMTKSQLIAFKRILESRVQLVWGPPGTGKTHFLGLAILCLAEASRETGGTLSVAISAFTHAAIDNCLRKLSELAHTTRVFASLPIAKLKRIELDGMDAIHLLDESRAPGWIASHPIHVVGGTAWSIRKACAVATLDVLVVDEGSQVKVPESAVLLRRLRESGRLVIAGDDRQLPPIVQGAYPEPAVGAPLLHRSIFECLRSQDQKGVLTAVLLENFRMNHTLCRFPAAQVYVPDYDSAGAAIAHRRLDLEEPLKGDAITDSLLDPAAPLVVAILEGVQATAENQVEAELVARTAVGLRSRLRGRDGVPYPESAAGDALFWADGLFVVSPHHAQINAIRRALARLRPWLSRPFVDTVDRMQGQECDAVIASYGVSDVEYALNEKEFIYSLNRLNVSITRARAKTIVFLPKPLIEPPIQAFEDEGTAAGVAFMQGLVQFARQYGLTQSHDIVGGRARLVVSKVLDGSSPLTRAG